MTDRGALDVSLLPSGGEGGRPLQVPIRRSGDAVEIGRRTQHLGRPVVMAGAHYTHIEDDLAALERFPHLLLETSQLAHFGAIESVVERVGAERLLYGSGAPQRCPSSPLFAVLMARISPDEKKAVLRDNAARLFGFDDGPVELSPPPLPARVFDVHCHFLPAPWPVPQLEDHELLPALGRCSIQRCVASSALAIMSDLAAGNARTAEACSGGGQLGYLVADPNDLELTRDQLSRWGASPGVVGVKVHAEYARQPTSSPAMRDLFRLLASHGRPVKIHNDGEHWADALLEIAREHPKLPIIVAHGGPGCPSLAGARLAAAAENVYWELPSSFALLAVVRQAVQEAGTERLLFGSDAPLLDPAYVLGIYADAGVATDEESVWWNGAARLFAVAA